MRVTREIIWRIGFDQSYHTSFRRNGATQSLESWAAISECGRDPRKIFILSSAATTERRLVTGSISTPSKAVSVKEIDGKSIDFFLELFRRPLSVLIWWRIVTVALRRKENNLRGKLSLVVMLRWVVPLLNIITPTIDQKNCSDTICHSSLVCCTVFFDQRVAEDSYPAEHGCSSSHRFCNAWCVDMEKSKECEGENDGEWTGINVTDK